MFKSHYIAFSAPSGTGKTTIVQRLADKYDDLVISVSATTREKRAAEIDGVSYHFISHEEFENLIEQDSFLEYEQVHGNYYGTLLSAVQKQAESGKTVLFDIDVNGALAIRSRLPETILIFLKPPHREALIERLKNRKSETEETIRKRLDRLEYEYKQAEHFDHVIINDHLEDAIAEVENIIIQK